MRPTSIKTLLDREMTGCIITNETRTVNVNAPSRSNTTTTSVIFSGLARVVDISNKETNIDIHDKQKMEKYCLYLDRAYTGIVTEGMKIQFNSSLLGQNETFVDNNTKDIITGYIRREVKPSAGSLIGKLELYVTTNN